MIWFNTFGIIGLVALALVSVVPVAKPAPPSLTTTLHVSPIPLQSFNITIFTPNPAFVWNFTVSLTGKDVGSDRFNLVLETGGDDGIPLLLLLFSDQNLTAWLTAPVTLSSGQELALWAASPIPFAVVNNQRATVDSLNFNPPVSGTYHIAVVNPDAFCGCVAGVPSTFHFKAHGYETWTTTIIA